MTSTERLCVASLLLAALSMLLLVFMTGGIGTKLEITSIVVEGVMLAIQNLSALAALLTGVLSLRRLSKDRSVPEQFTALAWAGSLLGGVLSVFVVLELVGFATSIAKGG